jgi:hypothetical protein
MNSLRIGHTLTAAALLAALGVAGMPSPGALATSQPVLNWTKQFPTAHPSARDYASIAYDAATGNVVLFGGHGSAALGDTWVWDGSTWTQQHPATSPPARWGAAMAYDAATGNVVLFGGTDNAHDFGDTWVWDGSTWTKQSPAASPSARWDPAMAYDAATSNLVLFAGYKSGPHARYFRDTWVWDGSTWAKQSPATSPQARTNAAMTFDAATGNVVLFGGNGRKGAVRGTWVWDGSTWASPSPASIPPRRLAPSMAYDGATGNVVLFGGFSIRHAREFGDTWVWDGSTWTRQHPATRPPPRSEAAMAYDAATGNVVLFGGYAVHNVPSDTWVWGAGG